MKTFGYSKAVLAALGLITLSFSAVNSRFPSVKTVAQRMSEASKEKAKLGSPLKDDPEYTVNQFAVDIDHFTNNGVSPQYQMRYLVNDKNVGGDGSPILFYTGNEGVITDFYDNSGFVT